MLLCAMLELCVPDSDALAEPVRELKLPLIFGIGELMDEAEPDDIIPDALPLVLPGLLNAWEPDEFSPAAPLEPAALDTLLAEPDWLLCELPPNAAPSIPVPPGSPVIEPPAAADCCAYSEPPKLAAPKPGCPWPGIPIPAG